MRETWLSENQRLVSQDNFGNDLAAVEAATKKHEAIETDIMVSWVDGWMDEWFIHSWYVVSLLHTLPLARRLWILLLSFWWPNELPSITAKVSRNYKEHINFLWELLLAKECAQELLKMLALNTARGAYGCCLSPWKIFFVKFPSMQNVIGRLNVHVRSEHTVIMCACVIWLLSQITWLRSKQKNHLCKVNPWCIRMLCICLESKVETFSYRHMKNGSMPLKQLRMSFRVRTTMMPQGSRKSEGFLLPTYKFLPQLVLYVPCMIQSYFMEVTHLSAGNSSNTLPAYSTWYL